METSTVDNTSVCKYLPSRGDKTPCIEEANTPYGFCKKHSRTIQAKKAKEEYEAKYEEPEADVPRELTPPLPTTRPPPMLSSTKKDPQKKKRIIKKNKWGRFMDPDTNIVFDPSTKEAYGVQMADGMLRSLGNEEIALCIKRGWNYYVTPEDSGDEDDSDDDSEEESERLEDEDDSDISDDSEEEDSDSDEDDSDDSDSY